MACCVSKEVLRGAVDPGPPAWLTGREASRRLRARSSGGAAARCRAPARVVRAHGRTKEREEIAATEVRRLHTWRKRPKRGDVEPGACAVCEWHHRPPIVFLSVRGGRDAEVWPGGGPAEDGVSQGCIHGGQGERGRCRAAVARSCDTMLSSNVPVLLSAAVIASATGGTARAASLRFSRFAAPRGAVPTGADERIRFLQLYRRSRRPRTSSRATARPTWRRPSRCPSFRSAPSTR